MDVVDSQVHLFLNMDARQGLAAMDALGIRSTLIDEYWALDAGGTPTNAFSLANGARRRVHPGAEMASFQHPDRFAYLVKLTRDDPMVEALFELAAQHPHVRAVRVDVRAESEVMALEQGAYSGFFKAAQRSGLPLFVLLPTDRAPSLRASLEAFSDLRFVLDHCGMPSSPQRFATDVLPLAGLPNLHLKWCHAPAKLSATSYPFADSIQYLQRAIDAYGVERILWASDFTAIRTGTTWAESLFYLRHAAALADSDREWILGRSARSLLAWH